VVRAITKE